MSTAPEVVTHPHPGGPDADPPPASAPAPHPAAPGQPAQTGQPTRAPQTGQPQQPARAPQSARTTGESPQPARTTPKTPQPRETTTDSRQATAESGTATARTGQATAEPQRATAESTRATAESGRATAGSGRATAERQAATAPRQATAQSGQATAEPQQATAAYEQAATAPDATAPEADPASAEADHPAVGAATALLDDYQQGARFLATPTRTLLAHGALLDVPHDRRPLTARVAETLAGARTPGGAAPVVIGAIPFDQHAPAALTVYAPEAVRTAPPLTADPLVALPAAEPAPADWELRQVPEPEEYGAGVAAAVERMWRGEFSKVVLARTLELSAPEPLDIPAMLQRLARRDPAGYTFALPVGAGRTLLGASPELLVSRRGDTVIANPLAGSTPRSADLAEDVRRAAALLQSAKDLHEHAVVVDAVHQALAPSCVEMDVPRVPTLVRTAAMWHLSTTVTGRIASAQTSALDLASALHPTPAVCGTPTDTAREVIAETEPFDRGFFTGMVGWGDADGDGEWVVTIRCAEAEERALRLYAGAGVVAASEPAAETAETAAKFRTFLSAVGAEL